jgi:hypothetical protein
MSNIAKGAATGASTGATLGSIVPGVGTVIGGAIGAVAGGIGGAFKDKKTKKDAEAQQLAAGQQMAAQSAQRPVDAPKTRSMQDMLAAGRRSRLAREMAADGENGFEARVRRKLTAEEKDPTIRGYRDTTGGADIIGNIDKVKGLVPEI